MTYEEIVRKTSDTLIQASTVFRPDQEEAYRMAVKKERNP